MYNMSKLQDWAVCVCVLSFYCVVFSFYFLLDLLGVTLANEIV